MFGMGLTELIILLIVALIVFGPGKLPQVGKALGKGLSEFKRAASGLSDDEDDEDDEDPPRLAG